MSEPSESGWGSQGPAFERYRRLVEASADLVTIVDSDGEITYANSAVETELGYDPGEVVGDRGSEYCHSEDSAAVAGAFETVRGEPDEPETVEFRVERADGSWCLIEATMQNMLDDDHVGGVVVTGREITERKERERDLVTTGERMELALEGANLGIWDWNMRTDEVSRDELLTEMLGYTQSEMGNWMQGWADIVHPADEKRHDEALAHHVSNRTPYYQCDHRLRTKSGDWKWVRTTGRVVERDANGEPVRAVGIHQDVDDRKRTKLALETERDLFANGPVVVFRWADAEGWPIQSVSENVADVLGYAPAALQSDDVVFADLIHDDDVDRVVEEVAEQNVAETDYLCLDPYRVRTEGGEVRWVMEYTRYVGDGESPHFLGYLVDITERREREQELEKREEKYRNLFEHTRDALMIFDREGYLDCNQQTLELFGIGSVEAFLDYTPWELSPQQQPDGRDSKEAALGHVETAFAEGEAFFEWTHQRADGTTFPAEVKLSRFELDGELALHGMVRDITERKESERRLEEQRDNLDILNQVFRHDIRNDIQLITAYTELLGDECDEGEAQDYVETVLENANHAVELTATAREMARVMLSRDEELQQVALRTVLATELEEVRSAYPDAVITQESDLPPCTVRANDMLGSVFRNLLKNAVQHNHRGVPKVAVSASTSDGTVVVRIADNGPGIPDEQKDAIFAKGEKGLDSSGTGIGLYLVETLVENYGGDVRVEDRAAQEPPTGPMSSDDEPTGAAFVVELPTVGSNPCR